MNKEIEKTKCHFCGTKLNIKNAKIKSNARRYGKYITCPNCHKEKVLFEIDEVTCIE